MREKQKTFSGIVIILMILLSVGSVSAKSIKLELCTNNNCYNYNENPEINYKESIILKASIINDAESFICWNGIQYSFKYISNNIGDYSNRGEKSASGGFYGSNSKNLPFCFSNDKRIANELYIPLKDYNEIEASKRLGSWSISDFSLTLDGLNYYKDVSLTEESPNNKLNDQNSFEGNEIKFTVITEEPKKAWFGGINDENLRLAIKVINGLLAAIAAGIWIYIFTSSKRKKPYKSAWFFTVVTILLAIFGWA